MVTVKIISPGEDYSEALKIRFSVFVKEQNIPEENEYDEHDKVSHHAVLFENEIPVACGRLYYTDEIAHIGRVAVLTQYRRKGYATTVCKKFMDIAIASKKSDIIMLDAQKYVVDLYKKLGFKVVGKEFLEENIPHLKMELKL
ncbi:MAG: GNAT family N-acetyltransferase [Oscillospiraceae bacterium]|nr:GNAT family N-acetyltransferase [Oscillospiraceae bacterium]